MYGVIEGFYGAFYTTPQRIDLIRFIGAHGFDSYLYAPKNDRQHRARWREPYPDKIMRGFAETVSAAQASGVDFIYSLSPGETICYTSADDFARLTDKFAAFYAIGVRSFGLLLDDISAALRDPEDRDRFGTTAAAHAHLCNGVAAWLRDLDPTCTLCMCPTDYYGAPTDYIRELGERLHPGIDVFYTGQEVCAPEISAGEVSAFAAAIRRPPVLWDNYPVNDLAMHDEMHIGAIQRRDPTTIGRVNGVMINTMLQPEASKVALLTYADFLRDPFGYDPAVAWANALRLVAGDEYADCVRLFAENSLHSCLGMPEARPLQARVDDLLAALLRGEAISGSRAAEALRAYLTDLDEACYALKFRMENLALRTELLPWIEKLELWLWLGRFALQTLDAYERRQPYAQLRIKTQTWLHEALAHPKRIGGRALVPLAQFALETVPL